jgi:hypothetical protein
MQSRGRRARDPTLDPVSHDRPQPRDPDCLTLAPTGELRQGVRCRGSRSQPGSSAADRWPPLLKPDGDITRVDQITDTPGETVRQGSALIAGSGITSHNREPLARSRARAVPGRPLACNGLRTDARTLGHVGTPPPAERAQGSPIRRTRPALWALIPTMRTCRYRDRGPELSASTKSYSWNAATSGIHRSVTKETWVGCSLYAR